MQATKIKPYRTGKFQKKTTTFAAKIQKTTTFSQLQKSHRY
jgi:hypothetical protein